MRRVVSSIVVGAILGSGGFQSSKAKGDDPKTPPAPVEVVATSGGVAATVLSVTPVLRPGTPPTPAITSGSGLARVGSWIFVAQDDSTMLAARADDGRTGFVRLFPPVNGADRFMSAFNNKKVKPDIEVAVALSMPASTAALLGYHSASRAGSVRAVLALGSGSKAGVRDRIAVIFPKEPIASSHVVAIHADTFYARLRAEPGMVGTGGELNVEGAALAGRRLRLFNRGNGAAGSVNGSVDVPIPALLHYLARAAKDPAVPFEGPFTNPRHYRLGTASDGFQVGITDAVTFGPLPGGPSHLRGEMRLFSAVVEHASSSTSDGFSSDASVVLELPDGRSVIAPLTGVEGASALKIEGISITKAEWKGSPARLHLELLGVVDADTTDPAVPSQLARLEVVYTP